jgi:hypothetical protein
VERDINEKVASWNWEIDPEEPCSGINQKSVAVETETSASGTVCIATCGGGSGETYCECD